MLVLCSLGEQGTTFDPRDTTFNATDVVEEGVPRSSLQRLANLDKDVVWGSIVSSKHTDLAEVLMVSIWSMILFGTTPSSIDCGFEPTERSHDSGQVDCCGKTFISHDLTESYSDVSRTTSSDGLWFHVQDLKKFTVESNRRWTSFLTFSILRSLSVNG